MKNPVEAKLILGLDVYIALRKNLERAIEEKDISQIETFEILVDSYCKNFSVSGAMLIELLQKLVQVTNYRRVVVIEFEESKIPF